MSMMGPLTKREHDAYQRGDRDGYLLGFTCGQVNEWCYRRDRVRSGAFGAIRRAVTLARRRDREIEQERNMGWNPLILAQWQIQADTIRWAIRAAIGSDKA